MTFGEKPGVPLHNVQPFGHEVRIMDFEGVGFIVDNADSDAEAMTRVRELIAGLQVAGVAG